MKMLDKLYDRLVRSSGSVTIEDLNKDVLGVEEENFDSCAALATLLSLDDRFIFDGVNVILRPAGNTSYQFLKSKNNEAFTSRLTRRP